MIRRLTSIALASIALAAPASAELFNTGNGTYLAIAEDGTSLTIEIDHVDHEGDRLMSLGMIEEGSGLYVTGSAWVNCQNNLIAHEGSQWETIDHRTMNGYIYDVACR